MEEFLKFTGTECTIDVPDMINGFVKIFVSGELAAGGADRRLLLEINGQTSGYTSFVVMDGHAHLGEWDGSGIYLGRSAWFLDADFSADCTVSFNRKMQRIICNGQATFANGNNTILGYQSDGFLLSSDPVQTLKLKLTGGVGEGVVWVRTFKAPDTLA